MIDAERWYEYQKNYQKYGLDMKPQPEPRPRVRRKAARSRITVPLGNGRKLAFSTVLAAGLAMIMLIIIK